MSAIGHESPPWSLTIRYPDGRFYRGDFVRERMTGRGLFVWPDGSQYEGEWKDNLRHGEGSFLGTNGSIFQVMKGTLTGKLRPLLLQDSCARARGHGPVSRLHVDAFCPKGKGFSTLASIGQTCAPFGVGARASVC